MNGRDEVLARVRHALGTPTHPVEVPRRYRSEGSRAADSEDLKALLVDRLEDYGATVIRTIGEGEIVATLLDVLAGRASATRPALHAPGLPDRWLAGLEVRPDDGSASPRELDAVPAVVTGCALAIAETGTIVLDGSAMCGRRLLTLVPDVHVCIVPTTSVVETVPEGLRRLAPDRPLTFVSGPSATSDIELQRVDGVHGPRTLIVLLAEMVS
ncbi:LUD domain-containing protein [Dactylosporangium roseum]|uniref:LUD domain-containing protein n=1 Tax=Dactylosporangium roseum TaxID=47989 RepID=A0ABY5Z135_9ACTN|nr:LUD domain-containing protein [Dactylosporangium roseum]UWZ34488.1 LUD domain-containing protein [Dactylosporangium roseum]